MTAEPHSYRARLGTRLRSLSAPLLALIGVVVAGSVGAGGFFAFRTYDYIEHDNDFCMSCHLMAEPYERFAESAHRGLGCKACHHPSLIGRSQMALTQIVDNPVELTVHAEVTNDKCAECHINGDPEKWALVAQSAGHRIHFESTDSALQGLQCVECHSTGLHEFAATDRTCAQSGCHVDQKIQLAGMADLTIHCAACHGFNTPVQESEGEPAVLAALSPDQGECLSCHAMRVLVDLPDPDPHLGACAACHNPHEQKTPQEAVASCSASGCHERADTVSPMHKGISPAAFEDCVSCHKAHDFAVDQADCLSCHTDVFDDQVAVGPPASFTTSPSWAHPLQAVPDFRHSLHRDVSCASCHDDTASHGALTIRIPEGCGSCHHSEPLRDDCVRCHADTRTSLDLLVAPRSLTVPIGMMTSRDLPFVHADHSDAECVSCHSEGAEATAPRAVCAGCHEEHHVPTSDCSACHEEPPPPAHPVADSHMTCAGAECHASSPFQTAPRTRPTCLVCHQALTEHRPGRECVECHVLPSPGSEGQE